MQNLVLGGHKKLLYTTNNIGYLAVVNRTTLSETYSMSHRTLAAQKKLACLGFQYLDHPPCSADLAPLDYHLCPGLKKTIESSPFFVRHRGHCCRRDMVGRTTF